MVKGHASTPAETKKYLQDLQYSLNLDKFLSRDELIGYVEKSLEKEQLVSRLLYPASLSKKVIRKLATLISNH
jgi:hypothetical protein